MASEHVFLPWNQCPLTQTVHWLVDRFRDGPLLDLSGKLIVLNSSHAQNRLQEMIVQFCDAESIVYTPPTSITVGQLPEHLYQPQRPFASNIAQRLMWVRALQSMPRESMEVVIPSPPEPDEMPRWLNIVQSLGELHRDLASEMKRFFSGRDAAAKLNDPVEAARWEFLVSAQKLYWEQLTQAELWDRQTARMIAVDHQECSTDKDIIMVGAVDLNQVIRAMLMQVQDRVSILTFAGEGYEDLFDGLGCLNIDAWCDKHIDIPQQNISVADRPQDQADSVIKFLSSLDGKYRADEITVGVPDDSLVPYLESEFESHDIAFRYARGPSLLKSSFCEMLQAIADFCSTGDYQAFASLIRHPIISRHIHAQAGQPDWLNRIDLWFQQHLQQRITSVDKLAGVDGQRNRIVQEVVSIVLNLLEPLRKESLPLNQWPMHWNDVLKSLLSDLLVDSQAEADRGWIRSVKKFSDVLQDFQELDSKWVFSVPCSDFLRLVFAELKGSYIAPSANPLAISMLGWLDTPLDDAPVSVVTSFNEGLIPSSDPAHPFLTQSLRRQLHLLDNRRRYARDAYALELLIHSRQAFHIVVARQNAAGEPRTPSRLLMAMSVDELPTRAEYLFRESEADETEPEAATDSSQLMVPHPTPLLEPVYQIRVTDFKSYLACPYRFYLQKILKLRSMDDEIEEMTGGQFGEMLHDVLEAFGHSELKDSTDSEEIRLYLESEVAGHAKKHFGEELRASLRLQMTQAKLRLARFAEAQAEHRRRGWEIKYLEQEARYTMMVDDEPIEVIGRIDRIDVNQKDGRWLVLDYKTSDSYRGLKQLYFKKDNWIDLQLPLYQQLVKCLPDSRGKSVSLGLIVLPKKLDDIKFEIAPWDDADLRKAFDLASEIVKKVRSEEFWPPTDDRFFDPSIERICQTGVLKLGS